MLCVCLNTNNTEACRARSKPVTPLPATYEAHQLAYDTQTSRPHAKTAPKETQQQPTQLQAHGMSLVDIAIFAG
jgi:hypothetical protein